MPTQNEIANLANMTQSALSNILNGRRRPSWKKAKLLAKATNTSPELWLDGTPDQIRSALNAQIDHNENAA